MEQTSKKTWWRWGINRWIVLALLLTGGFLVGGSVLTTPVLPSVVLPAEPLFSINIPLVGKFSFTNTMTAVLLAVILLILVANSFRRAVKKAIDDGTLVMKGLPGALEALLEYLFNMTEGTAGKWARTIFPWFGSITLLVLFANWLELFPFVDSFGLLEKAETGGYPIQQVIGNLFTLIRPAKGVVVENGYKVIPFLRVVSTDLNFTVALALIAVIAVQIMGVRAQGMKYFTKFFFVKTLFTKPIFGVIDFGVGLLELVSEFSKILSFAFRLFGNIFAGSVLLFVMGFLLGKFTLVPTIFYMLEFFVGAIQAIVFGLLTMTFMAQATQGHTDHPEKAQA